ncbi:MAG TPA: hypothetical protein PLI09_07245 [Candidatus Hydrogenedentes bacterium]|nr:hypothetical protein [Candidatus Hydrogenedentota bacterium]
MKGFSMYRALVSGLCLMCMGALAQDLTLLKKAEVFQRDMEARFLLDGQALCKLKSPHGRTAETTYNMPDNAYMTGIYAGTQSMRYAVTQDPAVKMAAQQSIRALHLLCTISGKPGLLARAAWPKNKPWEDDGQWHDSVDGKYIWRGDVSSDQVAGVMFGFSLAYELAADDSEKKQIAEDVAALVDHILEHGLRIVDVTGKPTRFGNYTKLYVSLIEPMNALYLLQAIKVASQVTGSEKYAEAYRKYAVEEGYGEISERSRPMGDPTKRHGVNHSDDVLLFLAYSRLLHLEQDEQLRDHYLAGFKRMWAGEGKYPGVKPEANPLHAFLAAKYLGDDSGVSGAVDSLRWFPLDMKMRPEVVGKYESEMGFRFDGTARSPEAQQGQPIPVDRRDRSWSAWVMDPYHNYEDDKKFRGLEFNGHDYLLGYWLGRYLGYVSQE